MHGRCGGRGEHHPVAQAVEVGEVLHLVQPGQRRGGDRLQTHGARGRSDHLGVLGEVLGDHGGGALGICCGPPLGQGRG
ncbi:hypothetical protein ACFFX0_08750 [Citricoccus parietis]|uniref:Uncharacterized protein n=1 Tax=Citricoccus parietis TaxID=592307 RepID=A0ABV5FYH0_9MICC